MEKIKIIKYIFEAKWMFSGSREMLFLETLERVAFETFIGLALVGMIWVQIIRREYKA